MTATVDDPATLLDTARAHGDRAALARLLTLVEVGGDPARELGRLVHPLTGDAYTVGLTGSPGSGKSTLTSSLVARLRVRRETAGVLAIDPSSPFSGGAILGDRVRMGDHALDDGVFIRSMATRGHLGGLTLATPQAVRVLDAVGFDWVLLETVGVGQVEVEVAAAADTTVVVVNPGWGDAIQANKAGLMEIADVFVVNKSDRPGADDTRRDLDQMLDLGARADWRPRIVCTVGTSGDGVDDLDAAIRAHRDHLTGAGLLDERRGRRLRDETERIVVETLRRRAEQLGDGADAGALFDAVAARRVDPWEAAERLLAAD